MPRGRVGERGKKFVISTCRRMKETLILLIQNG